MAANRSLASFIAHKGRLPLHDVLSWQGGPAPADSASAAVVEHLQSVMQLTSEAALSAGPVLLVACEVRSRWSATLAANLLREHGAPQVLLLGLHLLA
jgi:ATP-dependent DNA helicase RecQ